VGELVGAELSGRPATIEGVAKHVPALPGILDPIPSPLRHAILLLVLQTAEGMRIPAP
jgi:hypothetical protein